MIHLIEYHVTIESGVGIINYFQSHFESVCHFSFKNKYVHLDLKVNAFEFMTKLMVLVSGSCEKVCLLRKTRLFVSIFQNPDASIYT